MNVLIVSLLIFSTAELQTIEEKLLVGCMDYNYPQNAKVVRIFTSSTFTGDALFLKIFYNINFIFLAVTNCNLKKC